MNSERVLKTSGRKEFQQATGLQDMLQIEVIYGQVHSLVNGEISSRIESEGCTNVNSKQGYCWNEAAEIGDTIGSNNRCNVVQQGGVCHWEVTPPAEEYDDVGSKEVIQIR